MGITIPNTDSPLIYVAGPFRASNAWLVEKNIRRAEELGMRVAELGGTPVIPHTMYRFWNGTLTDEFWLSATLDLLRRCDAAVFTENWESSSGARGELAECKKLGFSYFIDSPEHPDSFHVFVRTFIALWRKDKQTKQELATL